MLVHESAKKSGLAAVVFRKLNTKHCLIMDVDVSWIMKNVAFHCPNRSEELGRIRFPNLAQRFRNFVRSLQYKAQELQVEQIIVGLEPTGPYSLPRAWTGKASSCSGSIPR